MSRTQLPAETLRQYQMDHVPLQLLTDQALVHGKNRLDCVAETLVLLSILKVQGILTGLELVTVTGAWFQYGIGSAEDELQAAHCLPGQIRFNSRPIHTIPDWSVSVIRQKGMKEIPLASMLRNLSGRTDPVNKLVNQVDSSIERMAGGHGLKPILRTVTCQLLDNLRQRKLERWSDVTTLVAQSFADYRSQEVHACQQRLNTLRQDLIMNAGPENTVKTNKKILIVEQYLHVSHESPFEPKFVRREGFNQVAQDVIQDFDEKKLPLTN